MINNKIFHKELQEIYFDVNLKCFLLFVIIKSINMQFVYLFHFHESLIENVDKRHLMWLQTYYLKI